MLTAPVSLRGLFKAIDSPELLQQLFSRLAPSATVDWGANPSSLPEALQAACLQLRLTCKGEYDAIIGILESLSEICADSKTPERLIRGFRNSGSAHRFREIVRAHRCHVHYCALWLFLHESEAWRSLLISSQVASIHAHGYDEYTTPAGRLPQKDHVHEFERAIASMLSEETLHGEYVHVDTDDDSTVYRCLVSVNRFPNRVPQFNDNGEYEISRDANAINFLYEYLPESGLLRLKCPLGVAIRNKLAEIYARLLLDSPVTRERPNKICLAQHLLKRVIPSAEGTGILAVLVTGLSVSYRDKGGNQKGIMLRSYGGSVKNEDVATCLRALNVPLPAATVEEVDYELTYPVQNGVRVLPVKLREQGFLFACRDVRERNMVMTYLKRIIA